MILASGLNYGFARSLPHLAGICFGFSFMLVATGIGMHAVFIAFPLLQTILKYVGAAYLVYLAWQLARAAPMRAGAGAVGQPMTFLGAAGFQWLNPKAWIMAIGAITNYLPHAFVVADVLFMGLVFGLIGAPCVAAWASCGAALQRVLQKPRAVRVFNLLMAALLMLSLYPVLVD
jgi:threonine/homoserine/homoserine lactone efflux protein